MKFTGTTYRPPFEAESLLLQVTQGCSHNRCAFCTMYRNVSFKPENISQIEADLKEAREFAPNITRIFLENGDPFVLSADRLTEIAELIQHYLPKVETVAMYASINNIINKTDDDLKRLRSLGINELNIGVESGLDKALALMNKGYTSEQAVFELNRLRAANIDYGANIIFGSAGAGYAIENARATAKLLNETKPYLIFTGTIHADKGCPLYDDLQCGQFIENTFGEYLNEEEELLKLLDLDGCLYFGLHPSNVVPMYGFLNSGRAELLQEIENKRAELSNKLQQKPIRVSEGSIIY